MARDFKPATGGTLVAPISASKEARRAPKDSLVESSSHSIGDTGSVLYIQTWVLVPTYTSSSSLQAQGVVHIASVSGLLFVFFLSLKDLNILIYNTYWCIDCYVRGF